MQSFRFEGLSLTVEDVERAVQFYAGTLGLELAYDAAPAFAMIRSADGGTIGLLSREEAANEGVVAGTAEQHRGVHVEFTTDDLDSLYADLKAAGVQFAAPPHDEPWEPSTPVTQRLAPDGATIHWSANSPSPPVCSTAPSDQHPRTRFPRCPSPAPFRLELELEHDCAR